MGLICIWSSSLCRHPRAIPASAVNPGWPEASVANHGTKPDIHACHHVSTQNLSIQASTQVTGFWLPPVPKLSGQWYLPHCCQRHRRLHHYMDFKLYLASNGRQKSDEGMLYRRRQGSREGRRDILRKGPLGAMVTKTYFRFANSLLANETVRFVISWSYSSHSVPKLAYNTSINFGKSDHEKKNKLLSNS